MSKTAREVAIELFDSDAHNPFSNPGRAFDLLAQSLDAAGFIIVPKEPTQAMLDAGELGWLQQTPEKIYRAMIAKAQEPKP